MHQVQQVGGPQYSHGGLSLRPPNLTAAFMSPLPKSLDLELSTLPVRRTLQAWLEKHLESWPTFDGRVQRAKGLQQAKYVDETSGHAGQEPYRKLPIRYNAAPVMDVESARVVKDATMTFFNYLREVWHLALIPAAPQTVPHQSDCRLLAIHRQKLAETCQSGKSSMFTVHQWYS